MHEFSICRSLLDQVEALAVEHRAQRVTSLKVAVGPLCGVEPGLLERAYSLARCGTVAETAPLIVETLPILVECRTCGRESAGAANRLICAHCGDYRVELVSGDELILLSVEMECSGAREAEDDAPDARPLAAAGT